MVDAVAMHKQVLVLRLIGKFRTLGVFQADIDPLKRAERPYIADLDIKSYGFSEADLDTEYDIGFSRGLPEARTACACAIGSAPCRKPLLPQLRGRYMYMADTPQKRFIQERLEPVRSCRITLPSFASTS
jgi:2-oxoglutarate dehydrogenase E1 component